MGKKIIKWSAFLEESKRNKSKIWPVGIEIIYDSGALPTGLSTDNVHVNDILNLQKNRGLTAAQVPGTATDWLITYCSQPTNEDPSTLEGRVNDLEVSSVVKVDVGGSREDSFLEFDQMDLSQNNEKFLTIKSADNPGVTIGEFETPNGNKVVFRAPAPSIENLDVSVEQSSDPTAEGNDTIPTTAKVEEMIGDTRLTKVHLYRGWLSPRKYDDDEMSGLENDAVNQSSHGCHGIGAIPTLPEFVKTGLATRGYLKVDRSNFSIEVPAGHTIDVFEFDENKELYRPVKNTDRRYSENFQLQETTKFVKLRAYKILEGSDTTSLNLTSDYSIASHKGWRTGTNNNMKGFNAFLIDNPDTFVQFVYARNNDNVLVSNISSFNAHGDMFDRNSFLHASKDTNDVYYETLAADYFNIIVAYTDASKTAPMPDFYRLKLGDVFEQDVAVNGVLGVEKESYWTPYIATFTSEDTDDRRDDSARVFFCPVDNDGEVTQTKCFLTLPPNYSVDGKKVPFVGFRCGSDSFKDILRKNSFAGYSNLMSQKADYRKCVKFLNDCGYAVFDFHPCGIKYKQDDSSGCNLNMNCLKACYEFIADNFNVDRDKFYFYGKSKGGLMACLMPFVSPVPCRAVGGLAPAVDILTNRFGVKNTDMRAHYFADYGVTAEDANTMNTAWPNATTYDVIFSTQEDSPFMTFMATLKKYPEIWRRISIWSGICNKSFNELAALETIVANSFDGVIRHNKIPVKIWISPTDSQVTYEVAENYITSLQNGCGEAVLRTMPSYPSEGADKNTESHHLVDTSTHATFVSYTTPLGIRYDSIVDAYVELSKWFDMH